MDNSSSTPSLLPDLNPEPQAEIRFSPYLTVLCLLICLGGFALLLWSVTSSEVAIDSATTSRDLERLGSRLLSFDSRLSEFSDFEQGMFRLWGEDGNTEAQLRQWYAEISHQQRTPLDELYAGILDGEAELRTDLLKSMEEWKTKDPASLEFRQILSVVYLEGNSVDIDHDRLQARLAEKVPTNWFYFQLARRLASDAGDQRLQESFQYQFQRWTDPHVWKWRMLISVELLVAGIGFIGFVCVTVMWIKRSAVRRPQRFSHRISPWTFYEGLAVLARGGALSIILLVLLAVVPNGVNLLEDYGSILLYFPTVILVIIFLVRPKNLSALQVLGGKNSPQRLGSSFLIFLSVIGVGLVGDWLIMLVGDSLEIAVHWTEWFIPQLVWGSQTNLLKTIVEVVLFAPFFEEIIFRGIVFTTLRAKFSFSVSMIASAAIFALAHGYGPIAFLAVFWSGLLWAWSYERTGSVVPGMCAHAINNGLVVGFLIVFFR